MEGCGRGGSPLHKRQTSGRIRALGERAVATLKAWKLQAKLHCGPNRATVIVQAILVLQHTEDDRYHDENGSLVLNPLLDQRVRVVCKPAGKPTLELAPRP
jgi:hypothetical protein